MVINKRWLAVYTRPRWEKKVSRLIEEKGIETYCPLNKVTKKWSDRHKVVDEPLFKSYVFVRVPEDQQVEIRKTEGVVNFVYWLGKPAIVKDKEIETIKRFLQEHETVNLEPIALQPDQKVKINSGILMDKEATVLKVHNNRVEVVIESLGYRLVAKIHKNNINPSQ